MEEYCNYLLSQGLIRDSLMNDYSENDPLREQFWQYWVHKEATLNNELLPIFTAKMHYSSN